MPVKHENPILSYIYHAHTEPSKTWELQFSNHCSLSLSPTSNAGDFANLAVKELTTLMRAET